MGSVHTVSMMPHIPQQPCQTGLAKTGMEIRQRLGNNAPSLTLTCWKKQLQETLCDLIQDVSQGTLDNKTVEKNLARLTTPDSQGRHRQAKFSRCSGDKARSTGRQ